MSRVTWLLISLTACGTPTFSIDAGSTVDASVITVDAGHSTDAGTPDAGHVIDAGSPDAGTPDAGLPDAGDPIDAGAPDAGPPDLDAGVCLDNGASCSIATAPCCFNRCCFSRCSAACN